MEIKQLRTGSIVYGTLPTGCRLCQKGLKTVIFLTGLCPRSCFYCPLGTSRKNRDVIFVNEARIEDATVSSRFKEQLLSEIVLSASKGASITGGDPLIKLERTVKVIKFLKDKLGKNFHIHLYTSGIYLLTAKKTIEKLVESGLDELRIHSSLDLLEKILRKIRDYAQGKLSVGLEYPSIPNSHKILKEVIRVASKYDLAFVNLNELEFTETNAYALLSRGFKVGNNYRSALGSKETAEDIIKWTKDKGYNITVHYCPVEVKDTYQTGLRHYRKSVVSGMEHNVVTDDGTLVEIFYEKIAERYGELAKKYPPHKIPIFLEKIVIKGKYIEKIPSKKPIILEEEALNT